MTSHFSKGDIIRGTKRGRNESFHPIIYIAEIDEFYFRGGMISHSSKYGNIRFNDFHFAQKIDDDTRPCYFVPKNLIKKQDWSPFERIGRLSDHGIEFVISCFKSTTPQVWEDYIDPE